jgi:hypothetical protein
MTKKNTTLIIGVLSLLFFACKTPQVIIHGRQEYISLKLIDTNRYRYLYYNLNDTSFIYNFNTGKYIRDSKAYKLFPDHVNQEQYHVDVVKKYNNAIGQRIRIHITTDITGDYVNQYRIHLLSEDSNIVFHGVTVDTTIDLHLKRFKVRIDLADKFVKGMGNQLPTFTSITSDSIVINSSENEINIHIPVSFATYFYKYQREIDLRDLGLYWEMNSQKIPMRNVDF